MKLVLAQLIPDFGDKNGKVVVREKFTNALVASRNSSAKVWVVFVDSPYAPRHKREFKML
jgi:hypothetical protein